MTSHVARLYAFAGALLVFLLTWAVVAAHPWAASKAATNDPRVAKLALREQRLRLEQVRVQRIVDRRWARYRTALAARQGEIAATKAQQAAAAPAASAPTAAPSVRVVTLPPLTSTQSS
jgi:hypothetical protein